MTRILEAGREASRVVLMVLIAMIALVAFALSGCGEAEGGECVQRVVRSSAYYPYYQKEYVQQVILVEVQKDRYYSLSDLYRDRLYLELYERLIQEKPGVAGRSAVSPPAASSLDKQVLGIFEKYSCLKCHGAGSENSDLSDPASVPSGTRWAAHGLTNSGEMPKKAQGAEPDPLGDEEVAVIYRWAKAAKQAAKRD